ncbi:hypothetical protein Tco_0445122 [Tanacetum coccineum]
MGSSPNCTLKPSNSFEWRKNCLRDGYQYGNPPREGPKPFAVRHSTKLGQRPDLFKLNTHDLPLHLSFPAKVIQDLAFPQASQELFDPIEA